MPTNERMKELELYVYDLEKRLDLFKGANDSARFRLKHVEAELAAIKNDAWICADWCSLNGPEYAREAANRILEATKSEPGS
jgi:hypothetical protein